MFNMKVARQMFKEFMMLRIQKTALLNGRILYFRSITFQIFISSPNSPCTSLHLFLLLQLQNHQLIWYDSTPYDFTVAHKTKATPSSRLSPMLKLCLDWFLSCSWIKYLSCILVSDLPNLFLYFLSWRKTCSSVFLSSMVPSLRNTTTCRRNILLVISIVHFV